MRTTGYGTYGNIRLVMGVVIDHVKRGRVLKKWFHQKIRVLSRFITIRQDNYDVFCCRVRNRTLWLCADKKLQVCTALPESIQPTYIQSMLNNPWTISPSPLKQGMKLICNAKPYAVVFHHLPPFTSCRKIRTIRLFCPFCWYISFSTNIVRLPESMCFSFLWWSPKMFPWCP